MRHIPSVNEWERSISVYISIGFLKSEQLRLIIWNIKIAFFLTVRLFELNISLELNNIPRSLTNEEYPGGMTNP